MLRLDYGAQVFEVKGNSLHPSLNPSAPWTVSELSLDHTFSTCRELCKLLEGIGCNTGNIVHHYLSVLTGKEEEEMLKSPLR